MSKMRLPAVIGGLSRRMTAVVTGVVLVVSGGIATFALTGDMAPGSEPSPAASPAPSTDPAVAGSSQVPASQPPAASPATEAEQTVTISENAGGAGGNNLVMINNYNDGALRIRGGVQLNRINAPNVAPQNLARAYSSCTDCQALAVAMQVNLIRRDTNRVVPGNAAVAVNFDCERCATAAIALQYTLSVDDPMQTPREVRALVRAMDAELRAISRDAATLDEAMERVDAVVARFRDLARSLREERDVETSNTSPGAVEESGPPSPSPSPSPSATPSPSPSVTPVPTPGATDVGTPVPSPSS